MTDFMDFLHKQLKDPEIKKEFDALEPEFAAIRAELDQKIILADKAQGHSISIPKEAVA